MFHWFPVPDAFQDLDLTDLGGSLTWLKPSQDTAQVESYVTYLAEACQDAAAALMLSQGWTVSIGWENL